MEKVFETTALWGEECMHEHEDDHSMYHSVCDCPVYWFHRTSVWSVVCDAGWRSSLDETITLCMRSYGLMLFHLFVVVAQSFGVCCSGRVLVLMCVCVRVAVLVVLLCLMLYVWYCSYVRLYEGVWTRCWHCVYEYD